MNPTPFELKILMNIKMLNKIKEENTFSLICLEEELLHKVTWNRNLHLAKAMRCQKSNVGDVEVSNLSRIQWYNLASAQIRQDISTKTV